MAGWTLNNRVSPSALAACCPLCHKGKATNTQLGLAMERPSHASRGSAPHPGPESQGQTRSQRQGQQRKRP